MISAGTPNSSSARASAAAWSRQNATPASMRAGSRKRGAYSYHLRRREHRPRHRGDDLGLIARLREQPAQRARIEAVLGHELGDERAHLGTLARSCRGRAGAASPRRPGAEQRSHAQARAQASAACAHAPVGFETGANGIIRAPCVAARRHRAANAIARAARYRARPRLTMLYPLFRPLLFALDPETAHDAAFAGLDAAAAFGVAQLHRAAPAALRRSRRWGSRFPTASAWPRAWTRTPRTSTASPRLGFGFIECGTVTPRPQPGNPQAAPVPAARGRSAHQPPRLQQRRRRALSRQRRARPLRAEERRHPRP